MSYVAMPSSKQHVILRNIRDFNSLGIGILLVRGDLSVLELLRGGKCEPPFSQIRSDKTLFMHPRSSFAGEPASLDLEKVYMQRFDLYCTCGVEGDA
jgi:hypothetical protein